MNIRCFGDGKWFRIFLLGFMGACTASPIGCATVDQTTESKFQSFSFDINTSFSITFKVPQPKVVTIAESPVFIAISPGQEGGLIWARYDPGVGKEKDIHLTTVWLTLYRFPETELHRTQDPFDQIKSVFFESDKNFKRNVKYGSYENINDRSWLAVEFISDYRKGAAYTAEIFEDYVLIAGVRVFGETGENDVLRERRITNLREIVQSIRVEEL